MSTQLTDPKKLKNAKIAIYTTAIAVPLVVVLLFNVEITGVNLTFLPKFYATINGVTAIFLVFALIAIKRKNMTVHRRYIRLSLLLSIVFLACYVAYHMTSGEGTKYGDLNHDNNVDDYEKISIAYTSMIYYFILISHILLSIIIIPIVLFTYLFAWQGDFVKHKKWTRFAWPIWFYVAVSGVIVYWMISPYYFHN
jgi:putative membrane protein